MKKIKRVLDYIYKYGIISLIKGYYYQLITNYNEKKFQVETKGWISTKQLGIHHPESVEYSSVYYSHLYEMFNKLPVDKSNSTLLDYGCGKGRVIVLAASYQYKKIIGIELSNLIDIAKNNISKMKHRKTANIELKQCNAEDFNVPSDVNIIFFFNPFTGSTLKNVTKNIHSSYKLNPRKLYIIYFNNDHFEKIIKHQDWLTKVDQVEFHYKIQCGLYETN